MIATVAIIYNCFDCRDTSHFVGLLIFFYFFFFFRFLFSKISLVFIKIHDIENQIWTIVYCDSFQLDGLINSSGTSDKVLILPILPQFFSISNVSLSTFMNK